MSMQSSPYKAIAGIVQPGDIVAYGGDSIVSRLIRKAAGSNVSHAGMILQAANGMQDPEIVEATVDFRFPNLSYKVRSQSLAKSLADYHGVLWWLPLDPQLNRYRPRITQFLLNADKSPFNVPKGVFVVLLDFFQRVTKGHEHEVDFKSYFCSELVARALEASGAVGPVKPALVSPTDLCRWGIYSGTYHYIQRAKEAPLGTISGYNSLAAGSY